mmetsp:Transcript_146/g.272  ORF Transcript_146/g.272 Transcript_146/m.272 type:complete len:206 (-) Transcript_146:941-1558(-)
MMKSSMKMTGKPHSAQAVFPTILRIHEVTSDVIYYELVLVSAIFVPMQGFWNMIIYITPRYRKIRRERKLRNAPQKDKAALVRTGQDMKLALKGEVPSSKNATTNVAPSTVMKVISTPTVAQEEEKARNDSVIMKGLKSIRLVFQDIKEAMRQGGDEDVLETEIYKSDLQPVLEIVVTEIFGQPKINQSGEIRGGGNIEANRFQK